MNQDSKNSYEQKSWEFAVSAHERYKQMYALAMRLKNQNIAEKVLGKIAELENKFPQLKK